MTKNEGTMDRTIRAILGLISLVAAFTYVDGYARIALIVLAIVLLGTSATGVCLLYKPFGISTLGKKNA